MSFELSFPHPPRPDRYAPPPGPFEAFGIDHLSASSLNRWTQDRGAWVARYLYHLEEGVGAPVWRGSAVEAGLAAYVINARIAPLDHAMERFEKDAGGELSEEIDKERALIAPMLEQAIDAWTSAELGRPLTQQVQTRLWLNSIDVPVIGYTDFVFTDYCLDLKTTKALPSKPRFDHVLQVAGYARARAESRADLLYVTAKKSAIYTIDEAAIDAAIEEVRRRAAALAATLSTSLQASRGDRRRARALAATMCAPNPTSYYWSPASLADARAKIKQWA